MHNRRQEEAITAIRNTSESIIPSQKRSKERKQSTGFQQIRIWQCTGGIEVSEGDHQEGEINEEEEGEEGDCGFEGEEHHYGCEDKPALGEKS
jgi:hypothetical protein